MFKLPYDYGMELIIKAREKETERSAWELWLTYDEETREKNPFNEFLRKIKEPKSQSIDKRTDEEILNDAEHIIGLLKRSE